jgi:hypothetical protein
MGLRNSCFQEQGEKGVEEALRYEGLRKEFSMLNFQYSINAKNSVLVVIEN